jgi:hypothetical protein
LDDFYDQQTFRTASKEFSTYLDPTSFKTRAERAFHLASGKTENDPNFCWAIKLLQFPKNGRKCYEKNMPRKKKNPAIEQRLDDEIVVDCYNESERHVAWQCYLEDRLPFPFQARCLNRLPESPLQPGDEVTVTGLLEDDDLAPMEVLIKWRGRQMAVPLEQLTGIGLDSEAAKAISDWQYWCDRGYLF